MSNCRFTAKLAVYWAILEKQENKDIFLVYLCISPHWMLSKQNSVEQAWNGDYKNKHRTESTTLRGLAGCIKETGQCGSTSGEVRDKNKAK